MDIKKLQKDIKSLKVFPKIKLNWDFDKYLFAPNLYKDNLLVKMYFEKFIKNEEYKNEYLRETLYYNLNRYQNPKVKDHTNLIKSALYDNWKEWKDVDMTYYFVEYFRNLNAKIEKRSVSKFNSGFKKTLINLKKFRKDNNIKILEINTFTAYQESMKFKKIGFILDKPKIYEINHSEYDPKTWSTPFITYNNFIKKYPDIIKIKDKIGTYDSILNYI